MKKSMISIAMSIAVVITIVFFSTVSYAATVLTLNATTSDPYPIIKNALGSDPIDGPDSDHIINVTAPTSVSPTGNAFEFILHNTGDLDGSNTDRQRNEIKVYNGSPTNLRATSNSTFTYSWKFKLPSNWPSHSRFCHIFQIKADAGDSGAPLITFTTDSDSLDARHTPQGATMDNTTTICSAPLSSFKGVWCEATVTATMKDSGSVSVTVKRVDNGTVIMSGSGTKDMWREGANYNRPKWGIYRGLFDGIQEARIQLADIQIINGAPSSTPTPTPTPTPVPGALITNLSVKDTANAADWSIQNNIQVGSTQYGDRTFTFTTVPSGVAGSAWIRTANDSKAYTADPTVTFTVSQACDVYVASSDAITTKPSWMSGWTDTGMDLVNNEGTPKTFSLYKKSFAANTTVSLGNNGSTSNGMYTVIVKPAAAVNLALNKSATASSSWSSSYTPEKAFDGDANTRWVSLKGTTNGQWLRVDFGSNTTYNQVVLTESYDKVTSFKLQSSNDGTTFTDIPGASGTTIGSSPKTVSFSPVTSRYVRLYVITATADTNINEMEVYNR